MSSLIRNLLNAARHFTAMDFAIFKICLLFIGILLGSYFSHFFLQYIPAVWIIAVITWLVLVIQVIRYFNRSKD